MLIYGNKLGGLTMTKDNESSHSTQNQKVNLGLSIIKFQLLWYLFNFLILFLERSLAFELTLLDNLYLISFKIIGRSLFISFFLYWVTMTYQLDFKELGITNKDFFANLKLGFVISWPFVLGIIISHFHLNNLNKLIAIHNFTQLLTSLIYFTIIFITCLIPAFSIELFFRGFIFSQLKNKYNSFIAFILGSVYYMIVHFNFSPHVLILYFIISFITNYLYHKTDSLLAPTIFQATYQASLTTFLFTFTGWPF